LDFALTILGFALTCLDFALTVLGFALTCLDFALTVLGFTLTGLAFALTILGFPLIDLGFTLPGLVLLASTFLLSSHHEDTDVVDIPFVLIAINIPHTHDDYIIYIYIGQKYNVNDNIRRKENTIYW
jgi:hypothetical protein